MLGPRHPTRLPATSPAPHVTSTVTSVNEFLPKPRWREHCSPKQLGLAITATFASIVLFGAALLWALVGLLNWIDAPGWVVGSAWLALTASSTLWSLIAKTPATSSDMEYQPWTEYVVRYVMVASGTTRPLALRVITGALFGAPVACYFIVFFALALTGLV